METIEVKERNEVKVSSLGRNERFKRGSKIAIVYAHYVGRKLKFHVYYYDESKSIEVAIQYASICGTTEGAERKIRQFLFN